MLNGKKSKIAYLIGAGGTHANIKAVNGTTGLLMRDLLPLLAAEVRELVSSGKRYMPLADFVNELVDDVDFEHMITFFDESPSAVHRDFAGALRRVFERVLKQELAQAKRDLGQDRLGLYSALLDMYNVDGISERLQGILTLNYDDYIEDAAKAVYGAEVDFGVGVDQEPNRGLSVLKLHGSFGWSDVWPIRTGKRIGRPLWIPPGIRKAKDRYPFNLVWGLAREVLDCDILRVVGCRLGPSDWDLISLLFSTRHSNQCRDDPYVVEIIDSPRHAKRLKADYPYLDVRSVLEIDTYEVGKNLISELGGGFRPFRDLTQEEAENLLKASDSEEETKKNWFQRWLVQMGEGVQRELGEEATDTSTGAFRKGLGI